MVEVSKSIDMSRKSIRLRSYKVLKAVRLKAIKVSKSIGLRGVSGELWKLKKRLLYPT